MPRPTLNPKERALNVEHAATHLPAALDTATDCALAFGPNDPRTLRAWEVVETHGAVIHRQSRLLAGKSRGG